jgi:hypothetical protein
MKVICILLFFLYCSNFYSQNIDSILVNKFINSIDIDNCQVSLLENKNNISIKLDYSIDSTFVIISQGDCFSLEIINLNNSCNRISIFFISNNKYFNIFGFQNSKLTELIKYLKASNQENSFLINLSKKTQIDALELNSIYDNWLKYSFIEEKFQRKISKKFNLIIQNPFLGEKIY